EVLAVGDAAFQKKAIGKMQEVSAGGKRTVLFVSHNMGAVSRLCTRGVVLKHGKVVYDGSTSEAIRTYANINAQMSDRSIGDRTDRQGLGDYQFEEVQIENEAGHIINEVATGSRVRIHTRIMPRRDIGTKQVYAAVCFRDQFGARLFTLSTSLFSKQVTLDGETRLTFEIKRMPLSEGDYAVELYMAEGRGDTLVQDQLMNAFQLSVFGNDFFRSGDPQPRGLDQFYVDFNLYQNSNVPVIST
ncbi:MAG: Wzt carbohydrate-binding domain-containing protein, partial [Tunicatimonas sp.]|uniref:Wzt carbohydrate-binding domain-containing protein n=1 Tax=Tunicatimonas sp. TaxID=1940096 RepID=UPI003C72DC2F